MLEMQDQADQFLNPNLNLHTYNHRWICMCIYIYMRNYAYTYMFKCIYNNPRCCLRMLLEEANLNNGIPLLMNYVEKLQDVWYVYVYFYIHNTH